jgi:predicted RecB family endonuclease
MSSAFTAEAKNAEIQNGAYELPRLCGLQLGDEVYSLSPEEVEKRRMRRRKGQYAALAFYRIMAQRSAGNAKAASFYRTCAELYARALRPKRRKPVEPSTALRDEIKSWVVMAETIEREAHLTPYDYQYS